MPKGDVRNPVRCAGCGDWGILHGVTAAVECGCGHRTDMHEAQRAFWADPPADYRKDGVD